INGAKIFGIRPNSPFLFKVAATGSGNLIYKADNLPEGLSIDKKTGIITGKVNTPGKFVVKLKVMNNLGSAERDLRIKVGETICLTPPMGWNSWYVYSLWVSQDKIKQTAKAIYDTDLVNHGWTYVNIDDCWQGRRDKKTNTLQPNPKFADMKGLCDYVHSLGLKIGIYSTPWIGSYAGYMGTSSPNPEHDYSEWIVDEKDRLGKYQIFGEPHHLRRRLFKKFGTYYGDEDAKQWADWGFDYLKYDWNPNDIENTIKMKESLRKSGRDMVYSLSNSAPFELVDQLMKHANLWRTTGDIRDLWISISRIGFSQKKWKPFAGSGHWNDPDMLQVGFTAQPHKPHDASIPSRLNPEEQYTQMSLWCLLAAPLLLSCDVARMDKFTLNLLTNDEVIEVNQDPLGDEAIPVAKKSFPRAEVWAKNMEDGSKAVGLFNRSRFKHRVSVKWSNLEMTGHKNVRDLWRKEDLGSFNHEFTAKIPGHGVKLIKIF
ncbi:MAG: alpha-galactosidase, partial [Candidatus Lokiarchaeota archaeon]|nr:alpha-galactosidase [Candidatus Lokiarchaeota archaeon]